MSEFQSYRLSFAGRGSSYFKIQIVNAILCILTLGLYYPWAKEKSLKFLYGQTTFDESPFHFSGTGREMFKGFIKAIIILVALYALGTWLIYRENFGLGILTIYGGLLALMPLAIHGSYRYRFAKTSWKGIRFGYDGDRAQLVGLFFKGLFLTLITFGIYGPWFTISLRRYLLSHVQIGNARFSYTGEGSDYFWLNIKGYFLTIFTFGIYLFWWQKDQFAYFVDHLRLEQDGDAVFFRSTATGGGFAGLMIVNFFLLIFTFGLAYAWVVTRSLEFATRHIEMTGYYSFEALQQAQAQYNDATGEDMADLLDFGFVI